MAKKHLGEQTIEFENDVYIIATASAGGQMEHKGPYAAYFDINVPDAMYGEDSFEKAERKMFKDVVNFAMKSACLEPKQMDFIVGGDLLNQIISAGYAARDFGIPFFGIYGACSTMAEGLLISSILVDGQFADNVVCATSSHYATAERQFRYPLELGTPKTPTSQNTATAAGATIVSSAKGSLPLKITRATVGHAVDFGVTDGNNMGGAMAPAATETILAHFEDTGLTPEYYDAIITGDLGSFGSNLMFDMCKECGTDIKNLHKDCGVMIYRGVKNVNCGGSGCGCGGSILNGYFLKEMAKGSINKILFVATGALLSPTSTMQGESIPSIAHAIAIERG